jgi:hypothetical protein
LEASGVASPGFATSILLHVRFVTAASFSIRPVGSLRRTRPGRSASGPSTTVVRRWSVRAPSCRSCGVHSGADGVNMLELEVFAAVFEDL